MKRKTYFMTWEYLIAKRKPNISKFRISKHTFEVVFICWFRKTAQILMSETQNSMWFQYIGGFFTQNEYLINVTRRGKLYCSTNPIISLISFSYI
jgi:hypothetical protein